MDIRAFPGVEPAKQPGSEAMPKAVWSFADPKPGAEEIAGRVAFGRGIRIEA